MGLIEHLYRDLVKGILAIVNNNGRTEDIYTGNHSAAKPMDCFAIKDSSSRIDIIPSSRSCQCKIKEEKSNVSAVAVFSLCAFNYASNRELIQLNWKIK